MGAGMITELRHECHRQIEYVATKGNEVIMGTAGLHFLEGDTVEICEMYIDPIFQGQGYGKRFLALIIDKLKTLGVEKVTLHVDPTNEPALRLYKGAGFVPTCTELHMELELKGGD